MREYEPARRSEKHAMRRARGPARRSAAALDSRTRRIYPLQSKMDDETQQPLDAWADTIAALESEVRKRIEARARRMATNRRLRKADREFAKAQADAIGRAVVRRKSGRKYRKESG